MKVYVVYGYSFGECFCEGVYANLTKALACIYADFKMYLMESLAMENISSEIYKKELARITEYITEDYKHANGFYYHPSYNDDEDYSIYYFIEEKEIE